MIFLLDDFRQTISHCRSKETSGNSILRTENNPSYRQCLVTALLANELLGLDVYAEKVTLESGFHGYHYFNKDQQNVPVRFCDEQFAYEKVLTRKHEKLLNKEKLEIILSRNPEIKHKYNLLKKTFQTEITKILQKQNTTM